MTSVSISLDPEVLVKLDKERRWINRSQAVNKALIYIESQPGFLSKICGVDKLPPEYMVD